MVDAILIKRSKWTKLVMGQIETASPGKIQREYRISAVVFLLKMHTLNLIMRKHQTNPNWEILYKITGPYTSKFTKSRLPRKDYFQYGLLPNWKRLKRHIEKQRHYFANKGLSSQGYGLFQWSYMDARVGLWRRLSAEELMLLNCGVGEDSWESLGLQGDPTSPS